VTSSGVTDTHDVAQVQGPGVVTGRYGTIGEVFFVTTDFWPLNTTLYVKDFKGNDPLFVSYLLRTIDFVSHSGKSGVPGVNRNDLHKLEVALPPPNEQQPIAAALSDVGELIGALEKLIAKKRAIKLATMQQLLTGKTRLPGFHGSWREKRIPAGPCMTTLAKTKNSLSALIRPFGMSRKTVGGGIGLRNEKSERRSNQFWVQTTSL
jgi:type I restriction enzyme S subunit